MAARAVLEHEALMGAAAPHWAIAVVPDPRRSAARTLCPSPGPRHRAMLCVSRLLPKPDVSLGG